MTMQTLSEKALLTEVVYIIKHIAKATKLDTLCIQTLTKQTYDKSHDIFNTRLL